MCQIGWQTSDQGHHCKMKVLCNVSNVTVWTWPDSAGEQLENDGKTRLCFAVICCHDGSSANQREQQQRCAVAEYQLQKQATEFIEFKLTEYLVLTIVWLYFS